MLHVTFRIQLLCKQLKPFLTACRVERPKCLQKCRFLLQFSPWMKFVGQKKRGIIAPCRAFANLFRPISMRGVFNRRMGELILKRAQCLASASAAALGIFEPGRKERWCQKLSCNWERLGHKHDSCYYSGAFLLLQTYFEFSCIQSPCILLNRFHQYSIADSVSPL